MTRVSSRSSSSSSRRPWKGAGGQQKQQQQHYGMMILFMIVVVLLLFSSTCLYMHSTIQALDDEDLIQSLPTQNQHQHQNHYPNQHGNDWTTMQQQQQQHQSSSLQFLTGILSLLLQFLSNKARFSSSSSSDAGIPPSWIRGRGRGRPIMTTTTLRQRYYDRNSQQFAFFVKTKKDNDKDDSTSSTSSLSSNIDWEALQHHVDTKLRSTTTTTPSQPQTVDGANLWYDVYHCPEVPPAGYPAAWNVLQLLDHWKVDDTAVPPQIYNGICIFDWNVPTDRIKIFTYRAAEVPLMVQHHPELLLAAERWSHESYLASLIGANQPQRNEHSTNNHFMFWRTSASQQVQIQKQQHVLDTDWKPPTEMVALTFPAWYQKAVAIHALTDAQQAAAEHWYFRLNGAYDVLRRGRGVNEYLFDELPLFLPDRALAASRIVSSTSHDTTSTTTTTTNDKNKQNENEEKEALLSSQLFMVDVRAEHGLNCRFGMKGAIAEMHFDTTRNWIVLLQGTRRYILAHPSQCTNLELYPLEHPSGRHSTVNWSHPPTPNTTTTTNSTDRPFFHAQVNEVVLQAGDALYLPTSWFHFIVSLNTNYQCNARSGVTHESDAFLKECGFDVNGGASGPRR